MDRLHHQIPGFRDLTPIYTSARTLVLRANRADGGGPCVLKIRRRPDAGPGELDRTHHELAMLRRISSPGVIAAGSVVATGPLLALVLESFPGGTLADLALPLDMGQLLPIAVAAAGALADVHAAGVIHKDLSPSNILFDPASGAVKLIDFDLATTLARETPAPYHPRVLAGALAYLSPELTGRTSRSVDYRTDLYSLGAVLYELLAGRSPFVAADALELVHCHLARAPLDPRALNPAVPPALAAIVLKLLAKAPEERYQSAAGLAHDLRRCAEHWRDHDTVPELELGEQDHASHLLIPERLYGREAPVAELLAAFERAARGPAELVLVTGFSGIGKTSVINEVHQPIVGRRGAFARGKFEQLGRTVPFGGFLQALRDLMSQALGADRAEREGWRARVQEALGEGAQVVIDVVPELERLLGPQPPAPELSGSAAQRRFNLLLQKLVGAFASAEHPLVLFLDDLQWADLASLKLLALLLAEGQAEHLLLLGAYRDNEVGPTHPLSLALDELRGSGAALRTITLAPLTRGDVGQLVADALGGEPERTADLADLVYQRAYGNPFFTSRLLKALAEEALIRYQPEEGRWVCDVERARAATPAADVVSFMAQQLQRLPAGTLEVLRLAACVGSQLSLATLARVRRSTPAATADELWPALQDGLLVPLDEPYPAADIPWDERDEEAEVGPRYRFAHDRVQQAAYSLIPEEQRPAIHLQIGRLLLAQTPADELDDQVFALAGQHNAGADLIHDPAERVRLAELNLRAARKAKAAAAAAAATEYLLVARGMLPEASWQRHYALSLAIHNELAEAAYLTGDFAAVACWTGEVLGNAATLLDRVKAYETQVQSHIAHNELRAASALGLRVLRELGTSFPDSPGPAEIGAAFGEVQRALGGTPVAELLHAPVMADPVGLATMRILLSISGAVYLTTPALYPLVIARELVLSITLGNTPTSAYAYASYGTLLCGIVGDMEGGHAFGQLAMRLLPQLRARELEAKTFFMYYVFVHHWSAPIADTLAPLLQGFHSGVETGDLEFAGYSITHYLTNAFHIGRELEALTADLANFSAATRALRQEVSSTYINVCRQAVLNLRGRAADPRVLAGEACDEAVVREHYRQTGEISGLHNLHMHKLYLCYLFGSYALALEQLEHCARYVDGVPGIVAVVQNNVLDSLTRLALAGEAGENERAALLGQVAENQARLEGWAALAPMNYRHKHDLVEAERLRVLGEQLAAMDAYDRAVEGARAAGFPQDEALANELAARFYLAHGRRRAAQAYLAEAQRCYGAWGAQAKVAQLARDHAELQEPAAGAPGGQAQPRDTISTITDGAALDLTTVIKAMHTIAGEIDLARLLRTMLRIAIENAGAQRGALLLEHAGAWSVEALGDVDRDTFDVLQSLDLLTSDAVPPELIAHVARSRAALVLPDAARAGDFAASPYIQAHAVRSVICAPLIYQGQMSGIIYLENNRISSAFTADRLELLTLLSAQMALALENARLYRSQEEQIAERTRSLAEAKEAAEAANRAKSAFLAKMSHDLRTPLNGILGYASILRNASLDPQVLEGAAIIAQSGEHLLHLITDILDLAKIEAGKLQLDPADLHLPSFLTSVVSIVRARADEKRLLLAVDADPALPTSVRADERRLGQVLLNLLSNAVKFTDHGHVRLAVDLLPDEAGTPGAARLRFAVHDTGIGIPPDQLERIFQPFEQVRHRARRDEGTGLGLPISRQIVELMGGSLAVSSQLGRGSTFAFAVSLPVLPAAARARDPHAIRGYQGERRTLLVVDDVRDNRIILRELLEPLGFRVLLADGADAALALALDHAPDAVLMDVVMPGRSGLEATRELRARGVRAPVVAVSASVGASEVEQARQAGCDAFLSKPVMLDALLETLGEQLALDWTDGEGQAGGAATGAPEPAGWAPVGRADLEGLLEQVERGNLQAVAAQAARLASGAPEHAPLAARVQELVRAYDERGLLLLVRQLLEGP